MVFYHITIQCHNPEDHDLKLKDFSLVSHELMRGENISSVSKPCSDHGEDCSLDHDKCSMLIIMNLETHKVG